MEISILTGMTSGSTVTIRLVRPWYGGLTIEYLIKVGLSLFRENLYSVSCLVE